MTIRKMMIEYMATHGYGSSKPTPAEIQTMREYYDPMTDEEIFSEFQSDVYKEGQDSMRYY